MNKIQTLTKALNDDKTMSDFVKTLANETALTNYMAKYNAITLKNNKFYTVDNNGKPVLCPLDSIRQNALGAMHYFIQEALFKKNATPQQKEAKRAREKLDQERMNHTGIFKTV